MSKKGNGEGDSSEATDANTVGDDIAYSPTTNTPLQFQDEEGAKLLRKCWYAGIMAPRKDDHMILGNQLCDNDILLQRCFLHGMHAASANEKGTGPNGDGLLAKCLSVGLFADKNINHP